MRQILYVDSLTVIGHRDFSIKLVGFCAKPHLAVLRRMLYAVFRDVGERFAKPFFIARKRNIVVFRRDRNAFQLGDDFNILGNVGKNPR